MERTTCLLSLALLLQACAAGLGPRPEGNESSPALQDPVYCYGLAMVGMDTVINSRLGIHPESLLTLAVLETETGPYPHGHRLGDEVYSPLVLRILFDAYLWEGAPQEYAAYVIGSC